MSELMDKRLQFTANLALLIQYVFGYGYRCAIAPDGQKHMTGSLHFVGLAADFAFYDDIKYLTDTEDYRFAGDYWKSLHPDFRWGGDFAKRDGNHFSCTYQGKS